jgi:4-oxalocrotonate tautomerase
MPLVNVKLVEGVFSGEQKQQIVRSLTEAMVAIEGENMRPVTWVIVEEVKSGDWGIAGTPCPPPTSRPWPPAPGRLRGARGPARAGPTPVPARPTLEGRTAPPEPPAPVPAVGPGA